MTRDAHVVFEAYLGIALLLAIVFASILLFADPPHETVTLANGWTVMRVR